MSNPSISVVIPHLNQSKELDACLLSLTRQTLDQSLFEVIVVDNGSTSKPDAIVAQYPFARLLTDLTPGPGPARNAGIRSSRGEFIALIDADCRADRKWLSTALQIARAAPGGTLFGGDVRIWHEDELTYTAVEAYESVFAYRFKKYIERQGFSGTGNLVMQRRYFDVIGPFAGINVAEDVDWGHRARDLGYTFKYVSEMIIYHPPRRSLKELFIKWDRHLQHYVNMVREKPLWRLRWTVRAFLVLVSPLVDCVNVFASDRIHGVSRVKALMVLAAIRAYRAWKMIILLRADQGVLWNRDVALGIPDED